jgi:DNA-binding transcriptional LysR family regulator
LRYGPVIHTIAELLEQVAAGQGVAISSALLQDAYLRHDVAFVPVTDVEPSEVMLCTRPEDRSPRVELLRKLIEKLPDQVR